METRTLTLEDDGTFPNNADRPVILYAEAFAGRAAGEELAREVESRFAANEWSGSWRNGVFPYHHYHSNTHEVLGCYSGSARIQLGGESGPVEEFSAGDVVVIPAGVAHKRLSRTADFRVVGAYPEGRSPDMNYGEARERESAISSIQAVPIPSRDPIGGHSGPLARLFSSN